MKVVCTSIMLTILTHTGWVLGQATQSTTTESAANGAAATISPQSEARLNEYLAGLGDATRARIRAIQKELADYANPPPAPSPPFAPEPQPGRYMTGAELDAAMERNRRITELNAELKQLKSGTTYFPPVTFDVAKVGALGRVRVRQVVGNTAALVTTDGKNTVWLDGYPMGAVADGDVVDCAAIVEVAGTRTYRTSTGASATVYRAQILKELKPIPAAAGDNVTPENKVKAYWERCEQERQKSLRSANTDLSKAQAELLKVKRARFRSAKTSEGAQQVQVLSSGEYIFRSKLDKDNEIQDAQQRVSNAADQVKAIEAQKGKPIIGLDVNRVGSIGTLGVVRIFQIIDATNMIISRSNETLVWVEGYSTSGLVDGKAVSVNALFESAGTKTYESATGSKTIRHIRVLKDE